MDALDLNILNALRSDGRKRYLDLAGELGVSDATIHKRVRKLSDQGYIKGFEAVLDDGRLGYPVTAFVEVGVRPGSAEITADKLASIEGVVEAHEIHGHCDLLLKVRAKGLAELRDKLVKQIRAVEEVTTTEAIPVMRIVKEERGVAQLP